jgi:hypothetical protein
MLTRSHHAQLLCVYPAWALLPSCHLPEPPVSCCHESSIHLPSLVHVVLLPSHHPHTTCHVFHSLHVSPPCPSHLLSCLLRLSPFSMCLPCNLSRSLIVSYSTPHCFGPITPFPCPTFRAGLHAYSLSQSVIPGGSAGGPPRPEGAELAGPSSIPMKQLLERLVVVRHRLRHNGKARP